MRSLLFFFRVSFVASFLLDVLYGVRNKSELCVQVFLRDDSEWDSRRGSVCCTVLSELCEQTDIVNREDIEVLLYGFLKGVLCVL